MKGTDEKEYTCAAEGDEGFIKAIITGNEVVSGLKARITFISQKHNKVNLKEASLPLTQLTPRPLDTSSLADTAVRLLKLHLPYFDGNILKWPGFWDVFESSVDKQDIFKVLTFVEQPLQLFWELHSLMIMMMWLLLY